MGEVLLSGETARAALERKARMEAAGVVCPYQAAFLTVDREPAYLHATLQSFLEADPLAALLLPVVLAVGTARADYARPYEEMGIARVLAMTPEEEAAMNAHPVPPGKRTHHRFNTNYHRALTLGLRPRCGRFVFEDDVSFSRGWFRRVLDLTGQHETLRGDHFAFSLYSPLPLPEGPEIGAMRTVNFYGTQAVYYPPRMRYEFAFRLRGLGVDRYTQPCDLLLRDFCLEKGRPIVLTRHSLVQHEGMVTTGLTDHRCHRSPTFVP